MRELRWWHLLKRARGARELHRVPGRYLLELGQVRVHKVQVRYPLLGVPLSSILAVLGSGLGLGWSWGWFPQPAVSRILHPPNYITHNSRHHGPSVGKFAAVVASASCTNCLSGKYQSKDGSTSCHNCSKGRHAEDPGMADCVACDEVGLPLGSHDSRLL